MPDQFAVRPPRDLIDAMQRMRQDDNRGALEIAEAALANETERRPPYLAIASLAALRVHEPERAIPYLEELLRHNPDDSPSRINLANALIELERYDEALAHVEGRSDVASQRIVGFVMQHRGDLEAAAAAYRRAVELNEDDLSSWNNLGNVLGELDDFEGAIAALERAISIAPADIPIYLNLATLLERAELDYQRRKVLEDARKVAPDNLRILVNLGIVQAKMDDLDGAIETFRDAIERHPDFSDAHIELAMVYEGLNRIEDLDALIESIDLEAAPPEVAFLLAWQARRAGDFERAATLAESIPETVHPRRRFHLIGGIADRRNDTVAAFAAFERMNIESAALAKTLPGPTYRESLDERLALWNDEWATDWVDFVPDDGNRDPIFLVGMPRSGTTLLDTMLMGQPDLSVLEERPMAWRTVTLMGKETLPGLTVERIAELRASYFDFAREAGWDDNRWLVDKHPLNMDRVPFIQRLFPKARFILAERHPYDVVLSCFMANFTMNLAMRSFTSLEEAALTYDAVFSTWERGRALFPIDVREVRYERLVADQEAELRPLVEWLGLDWNERLLDHAATAKERGRVRTASYSQIRENLYTRARYRWRRYADELAPVMPILKPWVEKMGYETA